MEGGRKIFAIWLTGLPASGKSTLASLLAQSIEKQGIRVQILDSDKLRQVLTPDPKYTAEEREWFYQTLVYIGSLLVRQDVNIIIAATAHKRNYREWGRQSYSNFLEIYVRCPLEVCIERDQKGIYSKAMTGATHSVPGIQVCYEVPESPAMIVDTELDRPQEIVHQIMKHLAELTYLQA